MKMDFGLRAVVIGVFMTLMATSVLGSLEGQLCGPLSVNETGIMQNCTLAYTTCNLATGRCECDKNVSVATKMAMFPEITECIPFEFVSSTGLCLPTSPDACAILFPGAFCDTGKRNQKDGHMKCECQYAGIFPNCTVRVSSLCRNNATCAKDIPNSFCGDIRDGYGKCTCGLMDGNKLYMSTTDHTKCIPVNCAAEPCRGDPLSSVCTDTETGYSCQCKNDTKGVTHSLHKDGICCAANQMPCGDFKKCISVFDLCNNKSDCDDCSDEKHFFCTNSPPADNLQCSAIREKAPTDSSSMGVELVPSIMVGATRTVSSVPVVSYQQPQSNPADPIFRALNPLFGNSGVFPSYMGLSGK